MAALRVRILESLNANIFEDKSKERLPKTSKILFFCDRAHILIIKPSQITYAVLKLIARLQLHSIIHHDTHMFSDTLAHLSIKPVELGYIKDFLEN